MENYELNYEEIKQIDRVNSQLKELENELKSNNQETQQQTESEKIDGLFYEINNNKAILKMDIVKNYLEKIKNKSRDELKSANSAVWIMAVQIALRSTQI